MARVATLEAVITANTGQFTSGLTAAQGKLSGFKGGLASVAKGLTGFDLSTLGAAAGVAALAAGLKYSIAQAAESEAVMAQTEAVIKSTGGAAGFTASQIGDMAVSLSSMSTFSDEAIQKGQNLLLTFTNIGGDVFPAATAAMIDMATAMGTDASSGAIQLGKALNDPVAGISALTRVGVTFSAEQKEMIKTMMALGDVAGAQKIIIAELNKEFGGSAAAQLDTYAGKMAQLKNNVDNLAESVGNVLLPPLAEAAGALNLLLTWNDQVDAALVQHEANVLATADSYEEYAAEIMRANAAAGKFAPISEHNAWAMGEEATQAGVMSKASWEAAKGINGLTEGARFATHTIAQLDHQARRGADGLAALAGIGKKAAVGMTDFGRAAGGLRDNLEFAYDASMLLAMGLDGALGQAMEDYQGVMEETTPEIERLTAEIAEYQRTQGQTVTVTEVATTSLHEYELGTLKAAEAARDLSDYVGGDALELAQLHVNADKAQEAVNKLGEGLGISKDYTIDHTTALAEDNAALNELIGKQEAAEKAIRDATAAMILQQTATALGPELALEYAHATGLLSDADYELGKALQRATDAADLNNDSIIEGAAEQKIYYEEVLRVTNQTVAMATGTELATTNMDKFDESLSPVEAGLKDVRTEADHVTSAVDFIPDEVKIDTSPATTSLHETLVMAGNLRSALDGIPRDISIAIQATYTSIGDESFGGWTAPVAPPSGGGGGTGPAAPPAYTPPPGMNAPAFTAPGMRGVSGPSSGGRITINNYINDRLAMSMEHERQRQMGVARAEALM